MDFSPATFRDYIGAVLAADVDSESIAILTAMRFYADDEGRVFRTIGEISADARVNRKTTMDRLADLAARQIVRHVVQSKRGNVYQLTPPAEIQKSARGTSEVRHRDFRSPSHGLQKSARGTSEVPPTDFRTIEVVNCSHVATRTTELQNETTAAATAPAHVHTHAVEPLAPHPMPKPVDHVGSDRIDHDLRAAAIIGRHPSADRLTPMAVEAIRILRVDPSIFVLEQWLTRGYTLPRIVAGCTFAASKFYGRTVPAGELVNSATRWMNRATPDEYGDGSRPAGQSFSAPKPQRPHSSAGIWQKFGMPIPEPNRGTEGEF